MKKLLFSALLAVLSATAFAQEPILLRLSSVTAIDHPKGVGAEKFKELVHEYTKGRVRVENYHSGTLFGDRDEMAALRDGKVEMLAPSFSKLNGFYKTPADNPWAVLDLPYLFTEREQLTALQKTWFPQASQTMNDAYAIVVGAWDNGFRHLSTNAKITRYEDLAKIRPRIQPSVISVETYKAWGASARMMAYGELLTGKLNGVVDASENPASNFWDSRLMPTQKYLYLTGHSYLGYVLLMNRKFWEGLPSDIREQVQRAIDDSTVYQIEVAERDNNFAIERIRASGMTRVMPMAPEIKQRMKQDARKVVDTLSPIQLDFYNRALKIMEASRK